MEKEDEGGGGTAAPNPYSAPPLFAVSSSTTRRNDTSSDAAPNPGWLCNASFTTDISLINEAVSSFHQEEQPSVASDSDQEDDNNTNKPRSTSYELLEEEEDDDDNVASSDSERDRKEMKRKRRKNREAKTRRRSKRDHDSGYTDDFASRKSSVRAWADSDTKRPKNYYLDTNGDRDNLVYGSLYRMDVPRYKTGNALKVSGFGSRGFYKFSKRGSLFDKDGDIDALDTEVKSGGRYWSAKYIALERHKNLKRLRFVAPKQAAAVPEDFIPLSEYEMSGGAGDHASVPIASIVEESWEDEVLRKTRELNKRTWERPHDESLWLEFAEFQDKVASMQPQKGARLQTLEKKISILEKAVQLNPDSEELLICLLKSYQSRDSTDMLIDRWEKVLIQHSGSHKLWKEYLGVVQGEFSRFKVSDMRKMYAHAIQALSNAGNKQRRQVHQNSQPSSPDSTILQLELSLVDTFLSLCRFEWQAGYQELATALFQAEIEFSLFCPSLILSERSKLRLFEHFWNNDGPRVGEEGAVGWSLWLEKEEENRQRIAKEQSFPDDDRGGWTGWSEPLYQPMEVDNSLENLTNEDTAVEKFQEEFQNEDVNEEDDTEALLKQLGIDFDAGADSEVKDPTTWTRWSEEESSRDYSHWMPVHGNSDGHGTSDKNDEEPLSGVILFEDVSEYLFSLTSREAQLSLVSQFVEFFGGEISQWVCTNSVSWSERFTNLDTLPDPIMYNLRIVDNILIQSQSSLSSNFMEFLLGSKNDHSKRADVMKFVRDAILLCLNAFPRNYILQEAVLVAEELSASSMGSSTAFRALAKFLLKRDRQDVLLCGVYAKREALAGNMNHARRAFDMALSSVEGLPLELRSNATLLYFWYAEAELANSSCKAEDSSSRALHILSCLGSGVRYSPFECKPSSLQILRAHQGFKERLRLVRSTWVQGAVDDQSIALTCSAALFEEMTTGWAAGIKVLDEAFTMVLPERRIHNHQLEVLFNYYVRMLLRHQKQSRLPKVFASILKGLQMYPSSSELFKNLLEIGHLHTTPNKLRSFFDDHCHKKPSIISWLFALLFEMTRGGSPYRVHGLFERALANERLRNSVILWRMYIAYEISIGCNPSAARRIFFRAIHSCPWSKKLWLDGFLKLNSVLTAKELSDLQEVMHDKELNLRTDIYEILLQDDLVL